MVKFTHYAVASTSCHMHSVLLYFLLPLRALPVDHSVTLQAAPSCMPSHCLLCWKSIMIVIPSDYTHAMLRYQPESVVQVTATVSGGSENVALFCCWHTGLIFWRMRCYAAVKTRLNAILSDVNQWRLWFAVLLRYGRVWRLHIGSVLITGIGGVLFEIKPPQCGQLSLVTKVFYSGCSCLIYSL